MATSSTSASPFVTVTADDLAHALDKMGLTESVSAALLYDTILQLQSAQSPPQRQTTPGPGNAIPQSAKEGSSNQPSRFNMTRPGPDLPDFFDPVSVERRRKVREMMKESFPNGIPPPYKW